MLVRWAPFGVAAEGFASRPQGSRGVDVLGRFATPTRHPAFWIACWAVVIAELPCAS
jgi:hypothetical protein